MPITIKTAAMKARESVNDPWETITVKAEAELEPVLEITGDGDLDPGFTATDLTEAANELKADSIKRTILHKLEKGTTTSNTGAYLIQDIDSTKYIIVSCVGNRTETGYVSSLFWAIPSGMSGDYYMILCLDASCNLLLSTDVAIDVYYMEK